MRVAAGEGQAERWREGLSRSLEKRLREGRATALLLVRIEATRPGGATLSLIEQEGILARALGCAADAESDAVVEPLSLDSFGLIFAQAPSNAALGAAADQLRSVLTRHLNIDTAFDVDTVMGLARAPEHAKDATSLLTAADAALSDAEPGPGLTVYSSAAQDRAVERDQKALKLRNAFERNEICLHYQPQVDPRTGRTSTLEALARWNLDGVLLPPGEFFDLGGEAFFRALGDWTLRESLRQLAAWRSQGVPVQRVAVNVTAPQLRRGDFLEQVEEMLREAQLPHQCLELELIETHLVEHLDRCAYTFQLLRNRGVRIAIDDFGTGYSSLSYLKRLPVDTLKIDRSLTADVADPVSSAIVGSIAELAKRLQLSSVAEGIEREAQYLRIASLGCDRVQGWWIAKPQSADAMATWLRQRAPG